MITRRQWPFSSFMRPTFASPLDDVAEEVGRGGEIEEIIAVGVVFLVNLGEGLFELVVSGGIVEVSADITDAADEPFPQIVVDGAGGKLLEVFGDLLARIVVAHRIAADADDGKFARQQLLAGEVVERGNQLAAGQVAGKAEDHHDAGIGGTPYARFSGESFCLSHGSSFKCDSSH